MNNIFSYKHTKALCYSAYVVQAIVNNYLPLLFVFFNTRYNIPLLKITFIVTFNFVLQLSTDFAAAFFVDKIGYRRAILLSNFLSALGFILLTILPDIMSDPFIGILISVSVYAVGGGMLEVIVNPIIESCPASNREASMSILHSFYSWGCAVVILVSTIFFKLNGIDNWKIMTVLWTTVPIANMLLFPFVPLAPLIGDSERIISFRELMGQGMFWLILFMMMFAGAAEITISQWASAFAEIGLHVSKTVGDLAGAMLFAVLFGLSRTIYAGLKMDLLKFMRISIIICIGSYLLAAFSPNAVLSLIGCGIAGFSVGIFWPGTVSIAAGSFKRGGTLMFSLLAFAGDIGCSVGPTFAGAVAAACNDSLKTGIGAAVVFPILMAVCVYIYGREKRRSDSRTQQRL